MPKRDDKADRKRVREALSRIEATEVQSRMAWILYGVNGVSSALRFIRQVDAEKKADADARDPDAFGVRVG